MSHDEVSLIAFSRLTAFHHSLSFTCSSCLEQLKLLKTHKVDVKLRKSFFIANGTNKHLQKGLVRSFLPSFSSDFL